ncbi:hypothetical protein HN031_19105 [Nocardioides sp. zg-1308]|uniref:zinc ribbon domain-containing protein n=1 Tax=Nocardioides sp. zg-1308 TaxID=2736253 RepID=UPI0015551711|nr:zinc ribbon domain-containing protein [Nocardioides sp. zg-1308]NPD06788.1 hypothetical protein [Nocardioides sp. zg-1308]
MDRCVACGAELGVGRFCLNCGHRIGAPAPVRQEAPPVAAPVAAPTAAAVVEPATRADEAPAAPTPDPTTEPTTESATDHTPEPSTSAPTPPEATTVMPVQAADPTPVPPVTAPGPAPARRASEWDPRVELLPYEEVDDLDADAPLRGRAWIAWVVGAVVLLALVFVLLRVLGTDGDDTASDPTTEETSAGSAAERPQESASEGEAPDEGPTGVGERLDLARGATFEVPGTGPPTTDFDGNLVAYEASQMGDGDPSTTWRTAGDATGQAVTVTLTEPGVVSRVGLVNGYAKQVAGVDWYPNNRRILAVTWTFDDGTSVDQTFAERPGLQTLKVPPVETGTVTITIGSVTPPGSGNLGRDYTAISEVSVIGRRAG